MKTVIVRLLGALIVVSLAAIIGSSAHRGRFGPDIERERDAIRALGYPGTWEELHAKLAPDPDQPDAVTLYLEALSAFDDRIVDWSQIPIATNGPEVPFGGPFPERPYLETGNLVHSNTRYFQLLKEAASIPQCSSPYPAADQPPSGINYGRLQFAQDLRHASRMLIQAASYHAASANSTEAGRLLDAGLALSRLQYNGVNLLSGMIAESIEYSVLDACVALARHPSTDIETLDLLLRRIDELPDITYPLLGEIYGTLDPDKIALWEANGTGYGFPEPSLLDVAMNSGRSEQLRSLRFTRAFLESRDKPWSSITAHPDILAYQYPLRFRTELRTIHTMISSNTFYTLEKDYRVRARRAAVGAILLIRAYAIREGTIPTALSHVTADAYLDPFAGNPLMYRKLDNGVLVYSVGRNGTDDGGWNMEEDRPAGDDIAFVLRETAAP